MDKTSSDIESLRSAACSMAGHLAAIDLAIRVLIETHPYPDVLHSSFKHATTQIVSSFLNTNLPDATVDTMQEVLEEYDETIALTVEVNNEVKAEIRAENGHE